ncbi:MAG: S-layer homology domain-containing protein, partial [Candidatus Limivicinus sp.]
MRKKLGSIVISTALALSLTTGALAADPAAMTDISGHWARENICWAMSENLMNGVSGTAFDPDGQMTRGMFVTCLGRLAGIDPEAYKNDYLSYLYPDVDADLYYAPYINWATR